MIELGSTVMFKPFWDIPCFGYFDMLYDVVGTVIYINEPNNWFLVKYGEHGIRIGFKFSDIGRQVKIV